MRSSKERIADLCGSGSIHKNDSNFSFRGNRSNLKDKSVNFQKTAVMFKNDSEEENLGHESSKNDEHFKKTF